MPFDFPASPTNGQQVTGANGVVWIWDGVKWVASTAGSPFPVAPTPPVGDNDTSVATTAFVQAAVSTAQTNVGRNLIHNSLFNVAQRGAGPWTTNGYLLDRWNQTTVTDTISFTQQAIGDTGAAAIGDEAATNCLMNVFTGNSAAGAYNSVAQPIENARRLSGKTVTVSFWAAASAVLKLGINILQNMGTGGSPSASLWALSTGGAVTLSGTWTRYSVTIAIPSLAGKTLGTNGNHHHALAFWYSSGSSNNALAGNVGVQSGTVYLWGVQLEIGSVATPLEKRDPEQELRQCQRFYQTGTATGYYYALAGNTPTWMQPFHVTPRAQPTVALSGISYFNASAMTAGVWATYGAAYSFTVTATGPATATATFTASADL